MLPCKVLQRQAAHPSLHLRNFVQGLLILDLGLHPCKKRFITSVNLVPESVPDARPGLTVADKLGKTCVRMGLHRPKLTQHPLGCEPVRRMGQPRCRLVAAPAPLLGTCHHAGPYGVQHHIPYKLQEIGFTVNKQEWPCTAPGRRAPHVRDAD